jgi:FixJ family two-component response regulator
MAAGRPFFDSQMKLERPPKLIVFTRHADDRLWAEVLNLGGFDVLDFPTGRAELFRAVSSAWRNWREHSPERCAAVGHWL